MYPLGRSVLPFRHQWAVFCLFWLAVYLSPWLIIFARTLRGRIIGLAGLCFQFFAVWFLTGNLQYPKTIELYCSMLLYCLLVFFLSIAIAVLLRPKLQPGLPNDILVTGKETSFARSVIRVFWSEEDWLWLGVLLGTYLDWRLSSKRGAEIRARVQGVLDDMRYVGVYKHCRTPWIHVFDRVVDCFPTTVVVHPDHPPRGALIFLHGHGGNTLFQAFLLREFARKYQLVVVCPTFSYGPWELPLAKSMICRTVDVLRTTYNIAPQQTFLAGLSQGAAGVAVAGAVDQFAGLIFISPTMIGKDLSAPSFVQAWQGREVLVIHGEQDRHVTKSSVDAGIATLVQSGVSVQASFHPHADHSLFLLDTEEVLTEVGNYCLAHLPAENTTARE